MNHLDALAKAYAEADNVVADLHDPAHDLWPQLVYAALVARGYALVPIVSAAEPEDDMCPNCCTPWKCNGPHIPAEAR